MREKGKLILLISLFSLSAIAGCVSNPDDDDDMFEEPSSSVNTTITLKERTEPNYTFDETVTNENGSVSYEIFVRSFYDTNNDGIGDLNGVTAKLPYLKDLGIKTIWLMPVMPSPSYHGYDVTDYYAIHKDYGTMEDFENLTAEAKKQNIDIMIDIVFNHSSDKHPWFTKSYQDYINNNTTEDSKKDWYCWSEISKAGHSIYNNDKYYEARFSHTMPDFNTENEKVRDEMVNILKFWVDKGVDGFRFDAVKYFDFENTSYNVSFLTNIKDRLCEYAPNTYFVGECWANIDTINSYYKSSFDSFFKFNASLESYGNDAILSQVKGNKKANDFAKLIESQERKMKEANPNAYSSYFLSNHDMDRSSNSFLSLHAYAAASLTYLLPGTPFMYYGEEISLKGKRNTSPDDQSDVRRRLPMIWSSTNKKGECEFPEKNRMDLANNEQVKIGVEDQLNAGYSLVNHYKKVINMRNKYPFIKQSVFTNETENLNTENEHVLAYRLSYGDEYIIVIHNFEYSNVEIDVSNLGSQILDEVSPVKLIPELKDGKLKLGRLSTVIIK